MERPDRFKQLYLGMIVALLGLKSLIVVLSLLFERIPAIQFDGISEIRVLVVLVALLLGAREVMRHGRVRPGRGLIRGAVVLALLGLGCLLVL
jgi:hypothetical protein